MQTNIYNVSSLLLGITALIMLMGLFILLIVYKHRKKQIIYFEKIAQIEANYEQNLLKTQLEIQEQTFQHISREIHDNISLSLTLAKLYLNTLNWNERARSISQVHSSVELLSSSLAQLSNISKGLNADIIIHQGLLKAVEEELERIRHAGLFTVQYELTGNPVYLDNQQELIIFRIVQECFNNIIKHAAATEASLQMDYQDKNLVITVQDNGRGFDLQLAGMGSQAGLQNMRTRASILNGTMEIQSTPGRGTSLSFTIPLTKP